MQRSFSGGYHWVHIMIPNEDKISISERSDAEYAKANRLVLTLYDIYKKQEEARKKAEEKKIKEAQQARLSAKRQKQMQILGKLDAYLR